MAEPVEVKRIDIKEFRSLGFLQEANRHFFHPLGLALEIVQEPCELCEGDKLIHQVSHAPGTPCPDCDGDGYTERLGGVWDYRDDPEGISYGGDQMTREKAYNVRAEYRRHLKERNWMFEVEDGVQPLPDDPPQKERLQDLIKAGRSAYTYWANCDKCGSEMGVNMLGMGRCPHCDYSRNPIRD